MNKLFCLAAVLSIVAVAGAQVEIPEGFELVQITDDPFFDDWARINNCGQLAFAQEVDGTWEGKEIFLYDNGSLVQLTNNEVSDRALQINAAGTIVWQQDIEVNPEGDFLLMRYQDGMIEQFDIGRGPHINNLGHMTWKRFNNEGCSDANIFFYDGSSVQPLTENAGSNQSAKINDSDQITWTQYDFCPDPWESQIMLWSERETIAVSGDALQPRLPSINNQGQVAWGGPDGIELWQDGVTTLLTDWGYNPRLNELGDFSFIRWYDDTETWQVWLYIQEDEQFYQLTDDHFWNWDEHLNDFAEVVIVSGDPFTTDILLMRRIRTGDSEFDGDVDSDDFAAFESCFTGPGRVDGLCECRFLDIDHDGDVDCDDFTLFSEAWTGPGELPIFPDCALPCEGDANGDGTVDPLDSGFVLARFGCDVGAGDPNCDDADMNGDGLVDPLDVGYVLARFGPCP